MIGFQLAAPNEGVPIASLAGTHAFDVKLDGVRAQIAVSQGEVVHIVNRNGVSRFGKYPEIEHSVPKGLPPYVLLDGEIVSPEGFETVARRDKQSDPVQVARMSVQHPVSFVAFDILTLDTDNVAAASYKERRVALDAVMGGRDNDHWGVTVISADPGFFDVCAARGLEGVIAKRLDRPYRIGRTGDWIKYKVVHRITCVGVGYEPGKGTRAHFGAMHLALLDGSEPRIVGKVGTGFTEQETWRLKDMMDAGQMPLVEIEASNVTRSGVLRFPSYKGERTDLSVLDATIDQLDRLPVT